MRWGEPWLGIVRRRGRAMAWIGAEVSRLGNSWTGSHRPSLFVMARLGSAGIALRFSERYVTVRIGKYRQSLQVMDRSSPVWTGRRVPEILGMAFRASRGEVRFGRHGPLLHGESSRGIVSCGSQGFGTGWCCQLSHGGFRFGIVWTGSRGRDWYFMVRLGQARMGRPREASRAAESLGLLRQARRCDARRCGTWLSEARFGRRGLVSFGWFWIRRGSLGTERYRTVRF